LEYRLKNKTIRRIVINIKKRRFNYDL
jgi:hypothetical protein